MLILNKKSISNHENRLFQAELEKFRPHQNRLLQATHKQNALMKELTKCYGDLLQDKRVRSEQARYESYTRQRNLVLGKYKKVFQAFNDLTAGLEKAQTFYLGMKENVENLEKNVETFVNNRRAEGAQLLSQIERDRATNATGQADRERDRLRELMERMSIDPSSTSPTSRTSHPEATSRPSQLNDLYSSKSPLAASPYFSQQQDLGSLGPSSYFSAIPATERGNLQLSTSPANNNTTHQQSAGREPYPSGGGPSLPDTYNPMTYPYQPPGSLPNPSGVFAMPNLPPMPSQYPPANQYLPPGYIPPPPPPGPPPGSQMNFPNPNVPYSSGPGGYTQHVPPRQPGENSQQNPNDPWTGFITRK